MLFIILLLVNEDVSVDHDVVEEEKLSLFKLLSA